MACNESSNCITVHVYFRQTNIQYVKIWITEYGHVESKFQNPSQRCRNFQLCTPQNSLHALSLYSYALNEQGTQLCSLHSLTHTHKRWPISAMFSSNKISQHNLNSNIPYRPSTAHALHSFWIESRQTISAMLSIATPLQQPTTIFPRYWIFG